MTSEMGYRSSSTGQEAQLGLITVFIVELFSYLMVGGEEEGHRAQRCCLVVCC